VRLVPATDSDWPAAWAIQRDAFLDLVTRTWGGWTDEQVRKCERAWNAGLTRMIHVEGAPVGWVRVEHHADYDWLDLVVIAPSHQNRGIGEAVLRTLLDEAAARGVPLWLSVYRTNPARRLYARLGFSEHPRDDLRVLMGFPSAPPRGGWTATHSPLARESQPNVRPPARGRTE
jgi:GNAT superfamily N-acetyltransferase